MSDSLRSHGLGSVALPGSSIHGILQARILEWVAISSSRRSSWPRNWTQVSRISCIANRFFTTVPPGKPLRNETLIPWAAGNAAGRWPSTVSPLWGSPLLKTTTLPYPRSLLLKIAHISQLSTALRGRLFSLFSLPGLVFQITTWLLPWHIQASAQMSPHQKGFSWVLFLK